MTWFKTAFLALLITMLPAAAMAEEPLPRDAILSFLGVTMANIGKPETVQPAPAQGQAPSYHPVGTDPEIHKEAMAAYVRQVTMRYAGDPAQLAERLAATPIASRFSKLIESWPNANLKPDDLTDVTTLYLAEHWRLVNPDTKPCDLCLTATRAQIAHLLSEALAINGKVAVPDMSSKQKLVEWMIYTLSDMNGVANALKTKGETERLQALSDQLNATLEKNGLHLRMLTLTENGFQVR